MDITNILLEHHARYPAWQVDDLYKLLHQAALGSEHAAADEARARRWLEEELAQLSPGMPEPLTEAISPDGRVLRVHLRPYKARGLPAEELLQAFLQTARGFKGSTGALEEYWSTALRLAGEQHLPFEPAVLQDVITGMRAAGYPALHHSAAYVQAYQPAYRVAAVEYLPADLLP